MESKGIDRKATNRLTSSLIASGASKHALFVKAEKAVMADTT